MSHKLVHIQSVCAVKIRGITPEQLAGIMESAEEGVYTSVTVERSGVVIECCNHRVARSFLEEYDTSYSVDYHLEPGQAIDPASRDYDEDDDDFYDNRYDDSEDEEEWQERGRQDAMMMRVFGTTRPMGSGAAGGKRK